MEKKNINDLLRDFNFVVPEIQREYVWGAAKNKRVLSQFLKDIDNKLEQGDANIGFLYSYESGTEHYLIDGQQRYTTILLLCHYLAASNKDDTHSQFVSRLKLDNNVQAFAYRVRSNTESFLKNLLKSGVTDYKCVSDQIWYKSEYDNDPTIQSMLGALEVFGNVVKNCKNISLDNVLNHIFFWYFDVQMTSQGEELYITMNSRGEKLTDSEQIKPRLLGKTGNQKEYYGKEWDNWEEFFYNKELRETRGIDTIDTAMNNIIRIVLELKTCHEHGQLNPVEDAEAISIKDVAIHMEALMSVARLEDGLYLSEIRRLYGDSNEDGDFYVLKALLTERRKGQTDLYEYKRVYQTIRNHVRRNKLKNRAFLSFLTGYMQSPLAWYEYILKQDDESKAVFYGHELEKIQICNDLGKPAESEIWKAEAHPFWNGEIKSLISWSKNGESFNLNSFILLTQSFNLLFDQKKNDGWTNDHVRQALIVRLTHYPLYDCFFGYTSDQWKLIMNENPDDFKSFLYEFARMDTTKRDNHIETIKNSYPETEKNLWAEFVHHDYLLAYCNTKRIQYREEYGIECVQNSYKQPYSVKNMHLEHYLKHHMKEDMPDAQGWNYWIDKSGWMSVVRIYKYNWPIHIGILYRHNRKQYEIALSTDCYALKESDKTKLEAAGFTFNDNIFLAYSTLDMARLTELLKPCLTINIEDKI